MGDEKCGGSKQFQVKSPEVPATRKISMRMDILGPGVVDFKNSTIVPKDEINSQLEIIPAKN